MLASTHRFSFSKSEHASNDESPLAEAPTIVVHVSYPRLPAPPLVGAGCPGDVAPLIVAVSAGSRKLAPAPGNIESGTFSIHNAPPTSAADLSGDFALITAFPAGQHAPTKEKRKIMEHNDEAREEARKTKDVPNAVSTADLVTLVKKMVKRSLSLHFQAFYLFHQVDPEAGNIIWADLQTFDAYLTTRNSRTRFGTNCKGSPGAVPVGSRAEGAMSSKPVARVLGCVSAITAWWTA
jgi:hypothetical protein